MANGRVLIIDDEKNYLLILQAILEDEGYEVTTINDPEMVMPYLEDSEVDVVITDMKMPKITGKDAQTSNFIFNNFIVCSKITISIYHCNLNLLLLSFLIHINTRTNSILK